MAESETPGKYDDSYTLKKEYAEHERLMKLDRDSRERAEREQIYRDRERYIQRKPGEESYGEYRKRILSGYTPREESKDYIQYRNKGLPKFSPKRFFEKSLINTPVIRERDFSRDYNFLKKMYVEQVGIEQEWIGVRNVKSRAINNAIGDIMDTSFDILSSPLLEDPKIKLEFLSEGLYIRDMKGLINEIRKVKQTDPNEYPEVWIPRLGIYFENVPVLHFSDKNIKTFDNTLFKFTEFKKYVMDTYDTRPDLSTYRGQCQKVLQEIKEETVELKPDKPEESSWFFSNILKSAADFGKRLGR